jgi:Fungal N-terminal domain of STAND proteins
MTDPLSIAAGVAGLIGVASELTQACYGYYKKAKNAPSTVQDVISEIKLLRKALSDLEDICEQRTEPLPALEPFVEELSECEEKIAEFGRKIDNEFRNSHRLIKRLEWPFRDPEIRLFLAQIQRYRTVFESAKTNAILEAVLDVRSEMKSEAVQQDSVRKGSYHYPNTSEIY